MQSIFKKGFQLLSQLHSHDMEIMHCSVSLWLLKRTFDIYMVVPLSLCGVHCCPIPLMEVLVPIIPYVPSDNLLESTCKLFRFKMLSLLLGKVPMLMLYFTSYPFFLKKMVSFNAFLILLLRCHTVPEFACPSAFRIVALICIIASVPWVTSYELRSSMVGLMDEMASKCCQGWFMSGLS